MNNNARVTVNNDFFGHEWGDLLKIFTSDEVKSENRWQITSRVTTKSIFMATNVLFYFLRAILCPWTHNSAKNNHVIVAKECLFWLISIVTSPQLICDVVRTRGTSIVTSYSSIVLARASWHKGDHH